MGFGESERGHRKIDVEWQLKRTWRSSQFHKANCSKCFLVDRVGSATRSRVLERDSEREREREREREALRRASWPKPPPACPRLRRGRDLAAQVRARLARRGAPPQVGHGARPRGVDTAAGSRELPAQRGRLGRRWARAPGGGLLPRWQ